MYNSYYKMVNGLLFLIVFFPVSPSASANNYFHKSDVFFCLTNSLDLKHIQFTIISNGVKKHYINKHVCRFEFLSINTLCTV